MSESTEIHTLNDLPLDARLTRALIEKGFTELTEIQEQTLPAALEGKDILASAKTGSGKTAAFLLPILQRMLTEPSNNSATRALILVPTRELAIQIQNAFATFAKYTYVKCGLLIGGEAFKFQISQLRKNPEVLIATPGRLVEHLDKGSAVLSDLECFVLDEADQMLKMGFSEDLNRIASAAKSERQNFLFSATLKQKGMHRIQEWMTDPLEVNLDRSLEVNQAIEQIVIFADDHKHKERLCLALIAKVAEDNIDSKVFIFANTRVQCTQLGNFLKYKKIKAGIIHSEIAQSDRKQVMNSFRHGHLKVLVATDVAARGLDIENVELVINYTVAQNGDDHTHRIGRTGRAGKLGKAASLVSSLEYNTYSSTERYLKINAKRVTISGLEADYKGPKKLKASGKAAGSKVKKKAAKLEKKGRKNTKKAVAKKSAKKLAKPKMTTSGDGFGALRKRK